MLALTLGMKNTNGKRNTIEIDTSDGLITLHLSRIKRVGDYVVLGIDAPRRIGITRSDAIDKEPKDG